MSQRNNYSRPASRYNQDLVEESCSQIDLTRGFMSDEFEIHTVMKSSEGIIANYWVSFARDPITWIMVMDVGETPEESEANAKAHLAMLIALHYTHQEEKKTVYRLP